jgi:hypothetical protein
MKISTFVAKLESLKFQYGDLPVSTEDGMVVSIKGTPCRDGIYREVNGIVPEPNEICIDFTCE